MNDLNVSVNYSGPNNKLIVHDVCSKFWNALYGFEIRAGTHENILGFIGHKPEIGKIEITTARDPILR